jgi:hypothetical protein
MLKYSGIKIKNSLPVEEKVENITNEKNSTIYNDFGFIYTKDRSDCFDNERSGTQCWDTIREINDSNTRFGIAIPTTLEEMGLRYLHDNDLKKMYPSAKYILYDEGEKEGYDCTVVTTMMAFESFPSFDEVFGGDKIVDRAIAAFKEKFNNDGLLQGLIREYMSDELFLNIMSPREEVNIKSE